MCETKRDFTPLFGLELQTFQFGKVTGVKGASDHGQE